MRALILAIVLLAGCTTGNQIPSAGLSVTYPDGTTDGFDQRIDPDARPTQHLYQQNGTQHPDFYSVHDLMHELEEAGRLSIAYVFYGADVGFFACSINDRPALVDGDCPSDPGGFYEFQVDGVSSDLGISSVAAENMRTYSLVWTIFSN